MQFAFLLHLSVREAFDSFRDLNCNLDLFYIIIGDAISAFESIQVAKALVNTSSRANKHVAQEKYRSANAHDCVGSELSLQEFPHLTPPLTNKAKR